MKFVVPSMPKRNYGAYFFISSLQHGVRKFLGILVHGVLSQCGIPMWLTASEPRIFLAKLSGMRSIRNRVPDGRNFPPLTYRTLPTPHSSCVQLSDLSYVEAINECIEEAVTMS